MTRAYITGVAGHQMGSGEADLFAKAPPAGLILFARNCESSAQIRQLVADFRRVAGHDTLVLIDQEGGRVQRLRPPLSPLLPPAAAFLSHFSGDVTAAAAAARQIARLSADELCRFGIDTSCAPVLDVPVPGAHDIIGNRAYARDPALVARLGGAVAAGLMDGAVLPVMKHIPGHGRAGADSHLELPVVHSDRASLESSDFVPFKALSHLPAAMTAHVVYAAIDARCPATTSTAAIRDIVRGHIGFDGLLMSDDLSMKALDGAMQGRTEAALAAGCDLALHCNGDLAEMRDVAASAPTLTGAARRRFERALAVTRGPRRTFDREAAMAMAARLVSVVA